MIVSRFLRSYDTSEIKFILVLKTRLGVVIVFLFSLTSHRSRCRKKKIKILQQKFNCSFVWLPLREATDTGSSKPPPFASYYNERLSCFTIFSGFSLVLALHSADSQEYPRLTVAPVVFYNKIIINRHYELLCLV